MEAEIYKFMTRWVSLASNDKTLRATITLSDISIALHFQNERLKKELLPAISHLVVSNATKAEFELFIATPTEATRSGRAPWSAPDVGPKGEVDKLRSGRFLVQIASEISIFDSSAKRALFLVPDDSSIPIYTRGSPFYSILHWVVRMKGGHFVHAAAFAGPEKAILIPGKSGTGKSTLSLMAVKAGFDFLGDDYVLIRRTNSGPKVYSVYSSIKVRDNFEGSSELVPSPLEKEKKLIWVNEIAPHLLRSSAYIGGIAFLKRLGSPSCSVKLGTSGRALFSLLPSTAFQLPFYSLNDTRDVAGTLDSVPVFELGVGNTKFWVSEAIRRVLSELEEKRKWAANR